MINFIIALVIIVRLTFTHPIKENDADTGRPVLTGQKRPHRTKELDGVIEPVPLNHPNPHKNDLPPEDWDRILQTLEKDDADIDLLPKKHKSSATQVEDAKVKDANSVFRFAKEYENGQMKEHIFEPIPLIHPNAREYDILSEKLARILYTLETDGKDIELSPGIFIKHKSSLTQAEEARFSIRKPHQLSGHPSMFEVVDPTESVAQASLRKPVLGHQNNVLKKADEQTTTTEIANRQTKIVLRKPALYRQNKILNGVKIQPAATMIANRQSAGIHANNLAQLEVGWQNWVSQRSHLLSQSRSINDMTGRGSSPAVIEEIIEVAPRLL